MTLIAKIEAFLVETGMSATAFGMRALNDPPFVQQLRDGRDPKLSTAARVEKFICDFQRVADAPSQADAA